MVKRGAILKNLLRTLALSAGYHEVLNKGLGLGLQLSVTAEIILYTVCNFTLDSIQMRICKKTK